MTPESRLLIATALGWEARTALRSLAVVHSETAAAGSVAHARAEPGFAIDVLTTGMGPTRAERALRWALARSRPRAIVSLGCAGALDPGLGTGDLIVATEVRGDGGVRLEVDETWRIRLEREARENGLRAVAGTLLTSSAILASAADKQQAHAASGALAVEMEGAALGSVAREAGIPFAAVRAILDRADTEITFARDLVGDDGGLRAPALVAALLRGRARAVRELSTLARARRTCARSLERLSSALIERLVANEKALG